MSRLTLIRAASALAQVAAIVVGAILWWWIALSGRGFAPTLSRPLATFVFLSPVLGCVLPLAWRWWRAHRLAAAWLIALAPVLSVVSLIATLAAIEALPRDAVKHWAAAGLIALAWLLPWLSRPPRK